jgi:Transposase DDE domain
MAMLGSDVREVFEAILPDDALISLIDRAGFQERERKCEALWLLRTLVLTAASGRGGRQADVAQNYFANGTDAVTRSSFYRWFGPALENVMTGVRDRALSYARACQPDLPGVLGKYVSDWHILDSTTVKLPRTLLDQYPGAGDYAALKIHKRFSVGIGTTVDYWLSPAREHDAMHFKLDESWRGKGLLCDLGYASFGLIAGCEQHDMRYVIRLKDSWKPKVLSVSRGTLTETFAQGSDLHFLLAEEVLQLDGKVIDAEVELGAARLRARLVAVPTDKGYCFFLTNLPATIAPRSVADLYRVRWEIELDNKLDKSACRLDEVTARTGPALRALIHASMVASMIACLLAHHHRRRSAPAPKRPTRRKKPPIHPQALARSMAGAAAVIAQTFDLGTKAANDKWNFFADLFNRATDPNWRSRPSILDQMRGWTLTPGRRKRPVPRAAAASVPR